MAPDLEFFDAAVQGGYQATELEDHVSITKSNLPPTADLPKEVKDPFYQDDYGISLEHLEQLRSFNKDPPETIESCAHELFYQRCLNQPDATAVCAWDGNLSYGALDALSTSLASHLADRGVGPEVFVPIYFEKSRWTVVAMLGVLKAGGAFILLDVSHPIKRLEYMCREVKANIVVTSPQNSENAAQLASNVFVLDDVTTSKWKGIPFLLPSEAQPHHAAYVIFTSGTSGAPKGVVIEHSSFSSSAFGYTAHFGLTSSSRVLQFSSYAFDACILETLAVLVVGGCICIPSETERKNDLAGAANRFEADFAFFTPALARIMEPEAFPTFKTLVVGGEAMTKEIIAKWGPHLQLINGFGPAECSVFTTSIRFHSTELDPSNIGYSTRASTCWIVDPDDHEKLVPIGTVGELLIDGPLVGRGYLEKPEKTAEVFVHPPGWLLRLQPERANRGWSYKTGDLAKFASDGSIRFIGRKDTQAKLHGQRLELGEVEHHVRRHFPRAKDAIAEVIPMMETSRPMLVAFVWQHHDVESGSNITQEDPLRSPDSQFHSDVLSGISEIEKVVPSYMVPSVFVPLNYLPLSRSGKIDRHLLRDRVATLSGEQIEKFNPEVKSKRLPFTDTQRQLQELFAAVLRLPSAQISIDDHFLRRGGDSVLAIKLVALARDSGLSFTVADVFSFPRLLDLAERIKPTSIDELGREVAPFSLLKDLSIREDIFGELEEQGQVQRDQVLDIYPCTALQEGMISLTAKIPGQYVASLEYYLKEGTDIQRLKDVFDATVAANPILRTRIALSQHGSFQIVVQEKIPWDIYHGQGDYEARFQTPRMGPNERLVYPAIINPEADTQPHRFVLTMHHSLFDGWSLPLFLSQVETAYNGASLRHRPFNGFIDYLLQPRQTNDFWRSQFAGLGAATFPALPSSKYVPMPDKNLTSTISVVPTAGSEYTMSTAIRLAWALILSFYTDSNDVVFGTTVSGRNAPVAGIEEVTGPAITTLPFRVQLNPEDTIMDSLSEIQNQVTAMIPYEQIGLQNLSKLSPEAAAACEFQSHLGVQPPTVVAGDSILTPAEADGVQDYGAFASYAFLLICHLSEKEEDGIRLAVSYDSSVVDTCEAQRLVAQFEHVLRCIIANPEQPLRAIDPINHEDTQHLVEWNTNLPFSYDRCLHELVLDYAITCPDAPAISAYDGSLTFSELAASSARLARHLRQQGARRGSLIPLCFEKSKWSIISMIAVLRAGAACVCIDPKHPPERIGQILELAKPQMILASPSQKYIFADVDCSVITVPLEEERSPRISSFETLEPELSATPQDPCFIIFTSGSTGRPKGIMMGHANLCTSIRDHSNGMNVNADTRGLHFASYAFDASIYEIFSVLGNGGCVCIPSEFDRMNNITGFIQDHEVNWAVFTPSVVQGLIQPDSVPNLRTLVVGGEAVTQEIADTWASRLNLIVGYGPAETTICSAKRIPEKNWITGDLGRITGGIGWITLPSDPQRLAPIGAVGELVIEGPVVTHGYLDDPDRTAAAYISHPQWLTNFRHPGVGGPLYMSGDLVQYTGDGSIRFVGRKDTQVKLRGQRIELAEVEYHVRKCFPDADELAAEIVVPNDGSPTLVAFIVKTAGDDPSSQSEDLFLPPNEDFAAEAHGATTKLNTMVPSYMVPAIFLQLYRFPRTGSGKIDRRVLRQETSALPLGRGSSTLNIVKRRPETEKEELLWNLWSTVLEIPPESIGADDDFFNLGGHSISAMRLTSAARAQGLDITVTEIFQNPVLSELAKASGEIQSGVSADEYRPGSLLNIADLQSFIANVPGLTPSFNLEDVVDIFPCTDIQDWFIDSKKANYFQIHLPAGIDLERLEEACRILVQKNELFRTVFIRYEGKIVQVVLRQIEFQTVYLNCDDKEIEAFTEDVCAEDFSSPVPLGEVYFQPYIITRSETERMLVIRTTHAQFDGASIPLLLKDLSSAYDGVALEPSAPPFAHYVRYRLSQRPSETYQFWRDYLRGSQMSNIKSIEVTPRDNVDDFFIKAFRRVQRPPVPEGVTLSSVLRAAWAATIARKVGERDILFGQVNAGRDVRVPEIAKISGPTIIMCPYRVTIQPSWTVREFLVHAHKQYIRTMPFANVEFKEVKKHMPEWAPETDFSSVFTHQNDGVEFPFYLNGARCNWIPRDYGVASHFHAATWEADGGITLLMNAMNKQVSPDLMQMMADGFGEVISHFAEGFDKPLRL